MSIRKVIISILLFSGILYLSAKFAGVLAGLKDPPPVKISTKPKKYVKAYLATYGEKNHEIKTFGRVMSSHTIELSAEVQGKLLAGNVPLKKGASFNKGELLFKIDNTTAALNLQSRKSNFINSVSLILADIKIDYPKSFQNWSSFLNNLDVHQPLAPLPETQSVQEKTFIASKGIYSDYYSIKGDEYQLTKYTVYAPFDGAISDVFAEPGTIINSGTKVIKLIDVDHMEVEIPLLPQDIAAVKKGDEVLLKKKEKTIKAKVVRIANYLDPGSQSMNIYASFTNNRNTPFYEGDYIETIITKKEDINSMVAPRSALVQGESVYTVNKDSSLSLQRIEVTGVAETLFFFKGLKDSTIIVTEPLTSDYISKKVIPILE